LTFAGETRNSNQSAVQAVAGVSGRTLRCRHFVAYWTRNMTTVDTEFEEDSFEDDFEPEEEMEQYK